MISQLTIRNFSLIDLLTIDFYKNLNIFTGETGAGKSILIDAIRFGLGERVKSTQIRDKDINCFVEIVFDLPKKLIDETPVFNEYLIEDENELIINRTYSPDGRVKNKVNGFSITNSQIKELGNYLVDFHGPNDHQMILSADSHIEMLDKLCDFKEIMPSYYKTYREYTDLLTQKQKLNKADESRERELDMLKHQIAELKQVPLNETAYETLRNEIDRINNAEKLYESACQIIQILSNNDSNISENISNMFTPMRSLNQTDENTKEFSQILSRIQSDTEELISGLNTYIEKLSFEPEEARQLNTQYNIYYEILRKYGPTIKEAERFYAQAEERYDLLNNLEQNTADLEEKITVTKDKLKKYASEITSIRKKQAKFLKETVEKELSELGIKYVQFECRVEKKELSNNGADNIIFYISPNLGETLKPLAEIVSSGEAARVMLALKKALTEVDPIPVLIFDEIDAQIGGRLGTIIGKKLKSIAENRQVIIITHLPQIASFADRHFKVFKAVKNNRTITTVNKLEGEIRVKELAEMMSGEEKTEISIEHARKILKQSAH